MAWNDTSPCSFCGREISILKRFGNGQFCSKAHEEAFLQQQNQLAVEVLHRTHDALKAYRPTTSSIEDILGLPSKTPAPLVAEAFAEPTVMPAEPAPVAVLETFTQQEPPAEEEPVPDTWIEPPVEVAEVPALLEESREFDIAASAMLPRQTSWEEEKDVVWEGVEEVDRSESVGQPPRAMDREIFHFGDSVGKLYQHGFLSSLRRLWESLTSRR